MDQLTAEEEVAVLALDHHMVELERCVLSCADRVLFDRGGVGFVGGSVRGLSENGSVRVLLDGEISERELVRAKLLKAPAPTDMPEGQCVAVSFEHDDLPEGALRWQYGTIAKVHAGGELVDISFDNGEAAEAVPTYDVVVCRLLC